MFLFKKRELVVIIVGMLALLVTPNAIYGVGLGANLLTRAWWDTPGQHYIPDGTIPIHYSMEVFSYDDLYVNGDGNVSGVPTNWSIESVSSNLRGQLTVTGDTSQRFFMQGTAGEKLSFTWQITPGSGSVWPSSYELKGVAHGWTDPEGGFSASPAVAAKFVINNPHRKFTSTESAYTLVRRIVTDAPGQPSPSFSAPYGQEKAYYQNYAPFIEQGDLIHIKVPPESLISGPIQWSPPGIGHRETWNNIPVEGVGDSKFYTRGPVHKQVWNYPDDYEPWQHYAYHNWHGYPNPWPSNVYESKDGLLSILGLCAEIKTLDGDVIPLDDGIDESGVGLYGPGFVGSEFSGPAPASGYLQIYLAGERWSDHLSWQMSLWEIQISVIPEPSSLVVLVIGGLTLFRRRRK